MVVTSALMSQPLRNYIALIANLAIWQKFCFADMRRHRVNRGIIVSYVEGVNLRKGTAAICMDRMLIGIVMRSGH
jgi:hypothetical protein